MAAEYERLDRKHESLDAQDQRVHQSDRVDRVKGESAHGADAGRRELVVMARVGIGDAAAARGDAVETAFRDVLGLPPL